MSVHFASMALTNATHVCIGTITDREAESLKADGHDVDGLGYYLFLASEADPSAPIEVLGKFFDASHATRLARLLGRA